MPPPDKYSDGFSDQKFTGLRIVGHNGDTPGYEGQLDIYGQGHRHSGLSGPGSRARDPPVGGHPDSLAAVVLP